MASVIRGSGTSSLGGDLDIEGVLTYEDVASVDSIGIITARSGIDVGTGTSISSPSSNVLTLGTNNEERLRITSGGKIGVNETAPAADLVVKQSGNTFTTQSQTVALFQRSSTAGHGAKIAIVAGTGGSSDINFGNTADEDIGIIQYFHTDNSFRFTTNTSEKLCISSTGGVLIGGHTTAVDGGNAPNIEIVNTSTSTLTLARNDTSISSGNDIAAIRVWGNDSNGTYQQCAEILAEADGDHGTDDKPTALAFKVTADGESSPTERLRITSEGLVWNKASTSGAGNTDTGFYHGYSSPSTQSTGITMKTLGVGGGSGPFDTGVSVNAGNAGGVALLFATRNTSAGTATDGAVYLAQFYYNGNNTPLIVHLGGDNWVTWGQTAGNNLQASWSGASNYTFAMVMVQ